MKVAFIREKYDPFGGAERFTHDLAREMIRKGISVHLFTRKWIDSGNEDLIVHRIKGPLWPSLLRHAGFVYLTGRRVKQENFDIVQSNERTLCQDIYRAGDGVHARWLEIRTRNKSLWKKLRIYMNPFHRYMLWLEQRLFEDPKLKAVIVASEMVHDEIRERFRIDPNRIHTVINGVDLEKFHPRNRENLGLSLRRKQRISENTPVVLFIGSGFQRKGVAELIHAMALAGGNAKLWVVGKGRTAPYLKLAKRLSISSRVTFFGPQQDVIPFYAGADIFGFPTHYDPFGTVVLEAMASGLPVVTTLQCGAAELITREREGFVISDPGDTVDLSENLIKLYSPEFRRQSSRFSRKKAEEYPLDRTAREILEIYNRILPVGMDLKPAETEQCC